MEKTGIIFLDKDEVIIRVYSAEADGTLKMLHNQTFDLATFSDKFPEATDIIEIIAQVSLSKFALHITNWNIFARNLSETIIRDVSSAIDVKIDSLTLSREQELLCEGLLMELSRRT